jgi:hypothetical protein
LEQSTAEMLVTVPARNKLRCRCRRGINMYLSLRHCIMHRFDEPLSCPTSQ